MDNLACFIHICISYTISCLIAKNRTYIIVDGRPVGAGRVAGLPHGKSQGNLNFFKVRELSGNFAKCQGNLIFFGKCQGIENTRVMSI